jgi:hypothetical protein
MDHYFQSEKTQLKLKRALIILREFDLKEELHKQVRGFYVFTLIDMIDFPEKWDLHCVYSIGKISRDFDVAMEKINLKGQVVDIISPFEYFHMFLTEFYVTCGEVVDESVVKAKDAEDKAIRMLPEGARRVIERIDRSLPLDILRSVINHNHIEKIMDVSLLASQSNDLHRKWEIEIADKERRIDIIKESLDKYENAFNFVGLSHGFDSLLQEKKKESRKLVWWVRFSAISMVLPIIAEFCWVFELAKLNQELTEFGLLTLFPAISLVILATYFFRILLSNYKGVRSQISQLELRMTLCRFIQNYAKYSSELKLHNETTLERFEDIIFSNVFSNDDASISVFDGIEQFSKLVDKIKK